MNSTQYAEHELFVGGKWIDPGAGTLDVENPATEEVVGTVPLSGPAGVDAAVAAARRAFDDGPWPRMRPAERSAALFRLAEALAARQEEMSRRLVAELGCPVSQVRGMQIGRPLQHWEYIAEVAAAPDELAVTPAPYTYHPGLVVKEPVGVVAAITAFNYPFMLITWKLGPALAAGCPVVLKPAEVDPLLAFEVARAVEEADLPPGVVNLVVGGPEIGARLVAHDGVDAVTFTGSTAVGEDVLNASARGVKRVVLELGGKSPAVVLDDADVDALIPKVAMGYVLNTGQACGATTRLIVADELYDEVVEKVVAASRRIVVGDPTDEATVVGPLVSARQRERVEGYLATVPDEGGAFLLGGGRPAGLDRGYFVEPTVVTGLPNSATVTREEVFGPVLSVLRHSGDEEAVEMANDSPYGLAAVVYGRSRRRAMAVARRIRAGTVGVNQGVFNPAAPIGGYKRSGLGREGGPWGIDEFRELKHLSWT